MSGYMINLIVACDPTGIIGVNGKLPWHIPEDLKRFKELTMGNTMIMGRKTWESLPDNVRPLPGRCNIVLSNSDTWSCDTKPKSHHELELMDAYSIDEAIKLSQRHHPEKEIFIIGGASVYREALERDLVDRVYLTITPDVDVPEGAEVTRFPEFPAFDGDNWICTKAKEIPGTECAFFTWHRISSCLA